MLPHRPAYTATATRSGKYWAVEIHGLPDHCAGFTQGRTWAEAEHMTRDAIAVLLEIPADSFDVTLTPADLDARAALAALAAASSAEEAAIAARAAALCAAAQVLTVHGFSVRDAGAALKISYQRVSQLAPQSKGTGGHR